MSSALACAQRRWAQAVHRALVRFAQGEPGKEIGPPNRVGLENVETSRPGRFYEYPGDPLANGLGTPVNHALPR
jgi:hypothetical protein